MNKGHRSILKILLPVILIIAVWWTLRIYTVVSWVRLNESPIRESTLGRLYIGQSMADVEKLIGMPKDKWMDKQFTYWEYRRPNGWAVLRVKFDKQGRMVNHVLRK